VICSCGDEERAAALREAWRSGPTPDEKLQLFIGEIGLRTALRARLGTAGCASRCGVL